MSHNNCTNTLNLMVNKCALKQGAPLSELTWTETTGNIDLTALEEIKMQLLSKGRYLIYTAIVGDGITVISASQLKIDAINSLITSDFPVGVLNGDLKFVFSEEKVETICNVSLEIIK